MKILKMTSMAIAAMMALASSSFALGKNEKRILRALLTPPPLVVPTPSGRIRTVRVPAPPVVLPRVKHVRVPRPPVVVPKVTHVRVPTPPILVPKVTHVRIPTPPVIVPTVSSRRTHVATPVVVRSRRPHYTCKPVVTTRYEDEDCSDEEDVSVHVAETGKPIVIVESKPPRPIRERASRRPSRHHVWVSGYWRVSKEGWCWVKGVWVVPPQRGARWIPGSWVQLRGGYTWRSGYWYSRGLCSRY